MKEFTTRPAINRQYRHIIKVPYCGLQSMLSLETPAAYNAGAYGWNFDLYAFGDTAIVTGYRNMPGTAAKYTHVFEELARMVLKAAHDTDAARIGLNVIIENFLEKNS